MTSSAGAAALPLPAPLPLPAALPALALPALPLPAALPLPSAGLGGSTGLGFFSKVVSTPHQYDSLPCVRRSSRVVRLSVLSSTAVSCASVLSHITTEPR